MKCVIKYGKGAELEIVKRDVETKEDGDQWITDNVSTDKVEQYWIADQCEIEGLQFFQKKMRESLAKTN